MTGRFASAFGSSVLVLAASVAAAAEPARERYEARINDQAMSKEIVVGANTWKCEAGTCTATGTGGRVSVKGCVRFATNLGVEVTHYQFGPNALSAEEIATCQRVVRAHVAQRPRQLTVASAGQQAYDLTSEVGQGLAGDGSVRMVFRDGRVLLLTGDGKLFEFDDERRLLRRGQFARWESQRGEISGTRPITEAVQARCAHSTLRQTLKPGEIGASSSRTALCYPQPGVVRLFYTPVAAFSPADDARASRLAFNTAYREPEPASPPYAIKVSELQLRARVRTGSIAVSRPFGTETQRALNAVADAVSGCYRWVLGRSPAAFEGQGELLLSVGPRGKQLTALVLRYTYPNAPRLNACIEQLVFSAELPDLGEPIRLNVPFDLYLAHSADAELGP